MYTDDDERNVLAALLHAHPQWVVKRISINTSLRSKAVPQALKDIIVTVMKARYPTTRFNFPVYIKQEDSNARRS